jgi:hypothetical protein
MVSREQIEELDGHALLRVEIEAIVADEGDQANKVC